MDRLFIIVLVQTELFSTLFPAHLVCLCGKAQSESFGPELKISLNDKSKELNALKDHFLFGPEIKEADYK